MSTIVTRASKGSALSYTEMDANFTNLNTDKLESGALASYETTAHATATYTTKANNLSDVASVVTARTNLGVTATGADTAYNLKSANLSDVANASTARTNLGLGSAATLTAGTAANNAVQLTAAAKLPAVDGSLLTNLPAPVSPIKAWARFNGATAGSNAPTAGSGISTITRNAAGNYTVAFSPALANTNYAVTLVCSVASIATGVRVAAVKDGSLTVNGFDFYTFYAGTPTTGTDSGTDTMISVVG